MALLSWQFPASRGGAAWTAYWRPVPKKFVADSFLSACLQLNTRVLMDEIKATKKGATLDDFPDEVLDRVASEGYDFVLLPRSLANRRLRHEKIHQTS